MAVTDQVQAERLQAALGSQYRIERELGRGGMGIVYLARDVTLDRLVAVKVVHPDLSTNRTIASRFLAEARTIARLRHPGIVAVHAAGEVDGQLYYVMDYLSGETLRQRLARSGPLPWETAVRIAGAIASALDEAARAGVVHRDLKPENILLEGPAAEPRALLADFGIARLIEESSAHTGPGAVMGTPAYMSPEQAAGETVDARSDLYSLGVVTYEMLTGAPPFVGPNRVVISKQILDPPTPVDTLKPEVPAAVSKAVMRALAKTPDDRWQDGGSFRRALQGEIPTPPAPLAPRPRTGRRWRAALGVGVALALAAAFFVLRAPGPPAGVDPRHSILVLPFDNLREDAGVEWLRDGSVNMLTLALAQWRDLTVVDQERVHDLLAGARHQDGQPIGLELARRLARSSGAWTVVMGDFSRVGDSLFVVARTYDVATGHRLEVVPVSGAVGADVRSVFDDLAARLLDLSGAPDDGRTTLASATTGSVEAYRAYLRGVEALNHWRLAEASADLERAVAIDSTFSLAHYKLALTRGWISPADTVGWLAIRRAARTSERLPERERGLIEAYRTFVEGNFQQSVALYRSLVGRDSSDVDAWYGLADASFHGGYSRDAIPWLSQSLHAFRRVVGLDSGYSLAYEHMGALLTDAGNRQASFVLIGRDSLASAARVDSGSRQRARLAAQREAVASAQAWIRNQPGTPRAHYHLYKALLASGRVQEARQEVGELRAMYPDSVQPIFGFFDARAQLVGGDVAGAAETVRRTLPLIHPGAVAELDYASETRLELMTGANALAYQGDLGGATQVIQVGRALELALHQAVNPAGREEMAETWELNRLAHLWSATGAAPSRLRTLWDRGLALAQRAKAEERLEYTSSITPAALGVFLGPDADSSLLYELRKLTGRPWPRPVAALVALRRGDSSEARHELALADSAARTAAATKVDDAPAWGDLRPVVAEAHYELGDYAKVISVLQGFDPSQFLTRGFDPRWAVLSRVRLLRGAAYEQLGERPLAMVEYRAVVDQWAKADAELLPVVQQARAGLARLEGARG